MTERRALVIVGGQVRELSSSDTLAGASAGIPTLVASGSSVTVAANTQVGFFASIKVDGTFKLDGLLTETR